MSFYESSAFIEVLLITLYIMLAAATALVGWSVVRSLKIRGGKGVKDGLPVKGIAWGVFILLTGTLALTALLADTSALTINGKSYDDELWLRIGDMFIYSSGVLIIVATLCVAASSFGLGRRWNEKKSKEKK